MLFIPFLCTHDNFLYPYSVGRDASLAAFLSLFFSFFRRNFHPPINGSYPQVRKSQHVNGIHMSMFDMMIPDQNYTNQSA